MQKFLLLSGLILSLFACSHQEYAQVEIDPKPTFNTIRTENKTFMVASRDSRVESYIALLDNGRRSPSYIHPTASPAGKLESALTSQFVSQGFRVMPNNRNVVSMNLMEALSKVNHSLFSHEIDTKVRIQITAENDEKKFVKSYSGNAQEKGFSSASSTQIRHSLNNLLGAVLKDVANDPQLNLFINENF